MKLYPIQPDPNDTMETLYINSDTIVVGGTVKSKHCKDGIPIAVVTVLTGAKFWMTVETWDAILNEHLQHKNAVPQAFHSAWAKEDLDNEAEA